MEFARRDRIFVLACFARRHRGQREFAVNEPRYLLNTLSALASIFFLSEALNLPRFSIWEARAFAFRA
jgi:hypothetical protein